MSKYTDETKTTTEKTTIEKAPIFGDPAVVCKPLVTVQGDSKIQWERDAIFSTPELFPPLSAAPFVNIGGFALSDVTEEQCLAATAGKCEEGYAMWAEMKDKPACNDNEGYGTSMCLREVDNDDHDSVMYGLVYPSSGEKYCQGGCKLDMGGGELTFGEFPEDSGSYFTVATIITFGGYATTSTTSWVGKALRVTTEDVETPESAAKYDDYASHITEWGSVILTEVNKVDVDGEYVREFADPELHWMPKAYGEKVSIEANSLVLSYVEATLLGYEETQPWVRSNPAALNSAIATCQAKVDEVCRKLVGSQAPYACIETKTKVTSPSFTESLAVAYANSAVAASILIPLLAFLAAKISGRGGNDSESPNETELTDANTTTHTNPLSGDSEMSQQQETPKMGALAFIKGKMARKKNGGGQELSDAGPAIPRGSINDLENQPQTRGKGFSFDDAGFKGGQE